MAAKSVLAELLVVSRALHNAAPWSCPISVVPLLCLWDARIPSQAFDCTRKITYQNLTEWYKELRIYCENIPVIVVANKIDVDYNVRGLPWL